MTNSKLTALQYTCVYLDSTETSLQSRSIHSCFLPSKGSVNLTAYAQCKHHNYSQRPLKNFICSPRSQSWKTSCAFFQFKRVIKLNLDTKQGFASLFFSLIIILSEWWVGNRHYKILETHSQLIKLRSLRSTLLILCQNRTFFTKSLR